MIFSSDLMRANDTAKIALGIYKVDKLIKSD